MSANDGKWHHICATWRNVDGHYRIYKDGKEEKRGSNFKKGYKIKCCGSVTLGQEQDVPGGKFQLSQSFQGLLTNVNVWSVFSEEDTIKELSECCMAGKGDVYRWSDFSLDIKGNARVVIPSFCKPPGQGNNCGA